MKLAAIDIGSNAIRFQVTHVMTYEGQHYFKRLEYVRFPLRLGQDVFKLKKIGKKQEDKFIRLMQAFKILIDLYEVDEYYACATSAMREAQNGREIVQQVKELMGLKINIISGDREAELINRVVMERLGKGTFLHIDVGGGSTELNVIKNGQKMKSESFKIGSVRTMENDSPKSVKKRMSQWINTQISGHRGSITAVGTGGNISKIYELSGTKSKLRILRIESILEVQEHLSNHTLEERIFKLHLNPDRADVILPASDIYLHAMQSANIQRIQVPDVGLKDGIMHMLFEKHVKQSVIPLKD
ncbi:Ppx/GppA phosphatase family protein [Roseivirga sp.]|uniref:Ppx/GppA phosphatase family protein n=1 Tax=Roseivirga sp. TaxID=1964215 RepID=UPI003B5296B0